MSAYIRIMEVPEDANLNGGIMPDVSQISPFAETAAKELNSFERFDLVVTKRVALIRQVLGNKGAEYSKGGDRFSNFRDAARIEHTTAEKALLGMMVKHEVSVRDMVETTRAYSSEYIEEKIGDWINYLILLEGMLKERK